VKRGEVWTVSGGADYAGKPRPAVIVQDDSFAATGSVTVCPFTTDPTDAPLFRLLIEPSPANGLRAPSRLMIDKVTTVARVKLGDRLGKLGEEDAVRLNQAMLVFLGLATPVRTRG
jgi:mRNA interferase MazF